MISGMSGNFIKQSTADALSPEGTIHSNTIH